MDNAERIMDNVKWIILIIPLLGAKVPLFLDFD
jgi:hypothetical protein